MDNSFKTQIRSKVLAEAVAPALKAALDAWREDVDHPGAVFCQIQADGNSLKINGTLIEFEYAKKIDRVLKKRKREKSKTDVS